MHSIGIKLQLCTLKALLWPAVGSVCVSIVRIDSHYVFFFDFQCLVTLEQSLVWQAPNDQKLCTQTELHADVGAVLWPRVTCLKAKLLQYKQRCNIY